MGLPSSSSRPCKRRAPPAAEVDRPAPAGLGACVGRRRFLHLAAGAVGAAACWPAAGAVPAGTAAPPLLLAREAPAGLDPAGYLVSEKLDGIRAYWDGRVLRFRGGGLVQAPPGFTRGLPAQPLDGELWAGRGRFEALAAAVRDARPDAVAWRAVGYHVFDLPEAGGGFEARAARLQRLVGRLALPQLVAVAQRRVDDRAALRRWLDEVVAAGGEGLMLHRADASRRPGRHEALLKLKPSQDAEALVVGHLPGRGRHEGRLGALKLRLPDGREFAAGSGLTDAERAAPPPIGSTVTYRHRGLTARGLPRFPSFVRVREAAW